MKAQYIRITKHGKFYYADKEQTVFHREDGPAIENANGAKQWWVDGKLHREDGPAIEYSCGGKEWWVDGKLHREDGPAIENANGAKEWWVDGKLHREDGPAIEHANGAKQWGVYGKLLTEEQFNARFTTVELTMDQIATKFGVEVSRLKIRK